MKRYRGKISGPLLDRIDMQVEVSTLPADMLTLAATVANETSAAVLMRVKLARARQFARQGKCNVELTAGELSRFCPLQEEGQRLLNQVMQKFNLSARSYHRILKVARTMADLNESEMITVSHIGGALSYRCLDRLNLND